MKRKLKIALAACLALFATACGSVSQGFSNTPQSLIIGKWEMSDAEGAGVDSESAATAGKAIKMSAEFDRDGTAKMTMMGQTLQGRYNINGDNELVWTMNGITTKARLNVTENELDVTDDANRTIKYRRK